MSKILVTGGAGYVGSHTVVELLNNGFQVMAIDNMVNAVMGNGKPESLLRVERLTGKTVDFMEVDLLNEAMLDDMFTKKGPFDCVIHFAALKAVGESCQLPLRYYKNNVSGSTNLLEAMNRHKCKNIVFSSSATVYGDPKSLPIDEDHPTGGCTNPYGKTKHIMEEIMHDLCLADTEWKAIMLRYFNPVGAHPSGEIGEDPCGIPNNLMPYISQVAVGKMPSLQVYGQDYGTKDGTGVRDYVHVMDLAEGHVAAVKKSFDRSSRGWRAYNLGTGEGNSVLEVAAAFESVSGRNIAFKFAPRRAGDVAISFADCSRAAKELNWKAKRSLEEMCADAWKWQSNNPTGYKQV